MSCLTREPSRSVIAAPERQSRIRRRVLVSAYTISPRRGSEPAGGWNVCVELARHHEVHVLCSPYVEGEDYRPEIENGLAQLRISGRLPTSGEGLTVHYVVPPLLSRLLQRPGGTLARLFYYIGYRSWQRRALARARELMRERDFDLVHQLNLTGFREPGELWRLGLPFFWGPIGGACRMPWSYFRLLGWKDRLLYGVRNVGTAVQARCSRRVGRAARSAQRIWHISGPEEEMVRLRLEKPGEPRHRESAGIGVEQMLDSGTSRQPLARVRRYDGRGPLRLVWSGLHIGRKALPILLRALAEVERENTLIGQDSGPNAERWTLEVLGDGPLTARWRVEVERLGLADRVRWRGRRSRVEAMQFMADAHALVFTSLLEGSPHVVMEALSLGLPVICHDACGMGIAVTERCGLKIPQRTLPASVAGFAAAIQSLLDDPAQVERLSIGALERSRALSWEDKAKQIMLAYEQVLTQAPDAEAGPPMRTD